MEPTDPIARGQRPRVLTLVHPAPPAQPKTRRRRRAPLFTLDQENRIRAALRHARGMFGTWNCVADAMYVAPNNIEAVARGRKHVSGDIAVRLARALGVSVESLYAAPSDATYCQACGHRRAR